MTLSLPKSIRAGRFYLKSTYSASRARNSRNSDFRFYSGVLVNATSEDEARQFVTEHLREKKPLGFSEREIRKKNPKRTPWKEGLTIAYVSPMGVSNKGAVKGVVCD
jgi:hypothetical protein